HKEATLIALKNIEVKIDTNSATHEDRDSRIKLLHEIDKLDRLESLDLQQKSRINWDIEGDENSKFFHGIINQRRRTNAIHGIMRDGSWTTDPNLVKDTFLNFFKEKFELHDLSSTFPSTSFPSNLTVDDHTLLEKDVNMKEIKIVVWSCGNNKAPGPDGFTFGFIKRYLEIIKHDIINIVINYFKSKKIPSGSNSSFINLIR
nr:RNA-directed DNA polymerase, eukaryota [Tanacetum cinerariifolium]